MSNFDDIFSTMPSGTNVPGKPIEWIDPPAVPAFKQVPMQIDLAPDTPPELRQSLVDTIKNGTYESADTDTGLFDSMPKGGATPVLPSTTAKAPEDTTYAQDFERFGAKVSDYYSHLMERAKLTQELNVAQSQIEHAKAGGYWTVPLPGDIRQRKWVPVDPATLQDAQIKAIIAATNLSQSARKSKEFLAGYPESKGSQAYEAEQSKAHGLVDTLTASVMSPKQTILKGAEGALDFAAPIVAGTLAGGPEGGGLATMLTAGQIGTSAFGEGVNNYLTAKGVDVSNPDAVAQYLINNPKEINLALSHAKVSTAFQVGAALVAPELAGKAKGILPTTGHAITRTGAATATDVAANVGAITAGQEAANTVSGLPTDLGKDIVNNTLMLGPLALGHLRGTHEAIVVGDKARAALVEGTVAANATNEHQAARKNTQNASKPVYEAEHDAQVAKANEDAKQARHAAEDTAAAEQAQQEADYAEAARRNEFNDTAAQKLSKLSGKPVTRPPTVTPEQIAAEREAARQAEDAKRESVQEAPPAGVEPVGVEQQGESVPAQPEATPSEATPVKEADQSVETGNPEVDQELSRMGIGKKDTLGMGKKAAPEEPATTPEEHTAKVRTFVHHLITTGHTGLVDLVHQGKLIFTPNAKGVGMPESGNKAEYDPATGNAYVYTDHATPENVVGDLLNASVHEVTHTGQFNPRPGRAAFIGRMLGPNRSVVHSIIEDAASRGNVVAKRAVEHAREASGGDEDVYNKELTAYTYGHMAEQYGKQRILPKLWDNLVAGAKAHLRDTFGVEVPVSIKDVAYAVRQIPDEIARTEVRGGKDVGGKPLGMIGGRGATGYDIAPDKYEGARDKKSRFEFSDFRAEVKDGGLARLKKSGTPVELGDVLDHEELYKQYPSTEQGIKVTVDPTLEAGGAFYDAIHDTVHLSENILENKEQLRSIILHEVQHAIQQREGFIPGTNYRAFMSKAATRVYTTAKEAYEKAIKAFDLGKAIATLPEAGKEVWARQVRTLDWSTAGDTGRDGQARHFLESGHYKYSSDRHVQRQGEKFYALKGELGKARLEYLAAQTKAFDAYLRDYGEAEARNTQHRSRMTFTERKANPPESTFTKMENPVSVDRTLDANKYVGNPGAIPASEPKPTLGMAKAKAKKDELPLSRRVPVTLMRIISSAHGTGKVAREVFENALSSPAGERMLSEETLGKYQRALTELAIRRGKSYDSLNKEIAEKLGKLDKKSDNWAENRAAFDAVMQGYGEAGRQLMKFRDQLDGLTLQAIKARSALGTPLSADEKRFYGTAAANLGRYMHRQFAIHMGAEGQSYASDVYNAFEKYDPKTATPLQKEMHDRVAGAIETIVDDQLVIPDDAHLDKRSADSIRRTYSVWGTETNPKAMSVDQMRDELRARRDEINGNKDLINETAKAVVRDILRINLPNNLGEKISQKLFGNSKEAAPDSPILNYYRGNKVDKGITIEREQLPRTIRRLMGEIKDPEIKMLASVNKMLEFNSRMRMLSELKKGLGPEHLQPPGAQGRPEVKGMVKLDSEAYGPLQNHWVSKNMAGLLADNVQQLANFDQAIAMAAAGHTDAFTRLAASKLVKTWGSITSKAKIAQIVLKPFSFFRNLMGGPMTLVTNGNFNPANTIKAMGTAMDIIHYGYDPSYSTPESRRVATAGVTDSAFVGEISSAQRKELALAVRKLHDAPPAEWVQRLRRVGLSYKDTYAMMDVAFKISDFYHQADTVLPEYYKAQGIKKSQAEIDREAGDIVNDTHITFKRAAPLVKGAERAGLTNFGPYIYESFRSEVGNMRQGFRELERAKATKNPEAASIMRMQGAKRLLGQASMWGLRVAAMNALGAMVFGEDKDKAKKIRALLPSYMQNQDFMLVGHDTEGKPILHSISQYDPVGPITDILRSAVNENMDLDQLKNSMLQTYVAPRIGSKLIEAAFGDKTKKEPSPLVQELFPSGYEHLLNAAHAVGVGDQSTKAWTNVLETFLPGMTNALRPSNPSVVMDNPAAVAAMALKISGASMYSLNTGVALKTAGYDYSDTLKANRAGIKQLFDDHPNMDAAELQSHVADYYANELDSFNKLEDVYQGMIATGSTPKEIHQALKKQHVPVATIHALDKGEFSMQSISMKSMKEYRRAALIGKTGAEREAIKAKWDNTIALLHVAKEQANDEGGE